MSSVRPITCIGFALGLLALALLTVDPRAAMIAGGLGMVVSIYSLKTSQ